jgi:hypothetical protein
LALISTQDGIEIVEQLILREGLRDVEIGTPFVPYHYIFIIRLFRQQDYRNKRNTRVFFEPC